MPERTRRRGRVAVTAGAVGVVLAGFVVLLATREPAVNRLADSPLVGRPAPAIDAARLTGGTYRLDDDAGRWVLVNFFATWCVPCQREHPELVRFATAHAAAGDATVVSVVFDDDPDAVREFFAANGGDWPVVSDDDGRIAVAYGVVRVPESYLVTPRGFVAAKIIGGVTAEGLEDLLARVRGDGP